MAQPVTEEGVNAFMRQLKLLIGGVVVLFALPLLINMIYLDRRLDAFEDSLRYRPPQEIDEFSTEDVSNALAANPIQGQVVYVPADSHLYHDDGDPHMVAITLSVRNTSLDREIIVNSVRYFDTKGKEVKSYLAKSLRLPALATTEILVGRNDATGGSGANFLVEWVAMEVVTEPVIEAVLIDTKCQQGISFARHGKPVREIIPHNDAGEASEVASPTLDKGESR